MAFAATVRSPDSERRRVRRDPERVQQPWTQDAFVCLFAVFKTKSAWHWEFHLKELPSEISYSKACKWHCHVLVYKGVVFILDPLNCFISKITSLLFTSTIPDKGCEQQSCSAFDSSPLFLHCVCIISQVGLRCVSPKFWGCLFCFF